MPVVPPSPTRQRRWAPVPIECGPAARAALFQAVVGLVVIAQTEPASTHRPIIAAACALSILTLPFARFAALLSRDHPSVYWWAGRVWAVAIPGIFAKTIPGAYDGSGPALAERMTTPFAFAALMSLAFAIGAQGALLGVTKDAAMHAQMLMVVMAAIKLQVVYTHAYLMLQGSVLGGVALGYLCVAKYADLREPEREAAEAVVHGAIAVREPYVVTDNKLTILAINPRFTSVLGYDIDEVYGKSVSTILDSSIDLSWVQAVLAMEQTEHVWSVVTKDGPTLPVRITFGKTRCPTNGTTFYWAKFASMWLENRNAQLHAEKERMAWEMASHHDGEEDPREFLGASVHGGNALHRTLGVMQDQATTDEAVSCANSFDHVHSGVDSPTLPGHTLVAPVPPRTASPAKTTSSIVSCKSSVMDTVSEAAAKDITRAPPPPKTRLSRPKMVCSEPSASARPKAGKNMPRRTVPAVERLVPDPREDC